MTTAPDFASFSRAYEDGRAQVLYRKLVADLETPVSAYLKLGDNNDNAFLFESVQGGETRGRYSIIALNPDLIWRCQSGKCEINRNARTKPDAFVPDTMADQPLRALRALHAETRMALPAGLPPMAVGLFGYLGYDMVRLVENLPATPPDRLGVPDAILIRPTITAIFDSVRDEITIVTPVWPRKDVEARAAYVRAEERLQEIVDLLERPLTVPHAGDVPPPAPIELMSIIGKPTTVPNSMSNSLRISGVPSRTTETSVLVPPISIPIKLAMPPIREMAISAITPAAGPDMRVLTGFSMALWAVPNPPFDCMTSKSNRYPSRRRKPSILRRYSVSVGPTYAPTTAVDVRSNSRHAGRSSADR